MRRVDLLPESARGSTNGECLERLFEETATKAMMDGAGQSARQRDAPAVVALITRALTAVDAQEQVK